jgi:hypothetical protein
MTERYFDKAMTIRKRREVTKDGYTYITYEDFFWGEWVGNFNLFDADGKNLLHATLKKALPNDKKLIEYGDLCVAFLKAKNQQTAGGKSDVNND